MIQIIPIFLIFQIIQIIQIIKINQSIQSVTGRIDRWLISREALYAGQDKDPTQGQKRFIFTCSGLSLR